MDQGRVATSTRTSSADPLLYVIIFAFLFLISLGLLTWVLGTFYKSHACGLYPNIWCSDEFSCTTPCTTTISGHTVNPCFGVTSYIGSTGLSSCIFGPDAPGATVCFFPPTDGGTACACPPELGGDVQSCFNGCPSNLSSIGEGGACCCNDLNNTRCLVMVADDGSLVGTGICAPPSS